VDELGGWGLVVWGGLASCAGRYSVAALLCVVGDFVSSGIQSGRVGCWVRLCVLIVASLFSCAFAIEVSEVGHDGGGVGVVCVCAMRTRDLDVGFNQISGTFPSVVSGLPSLMCVAVVSACALCTA
jgi:hypothetical protein